MLGYHETQIKNELEASITMVNDVDVIKSILYQRNGQLKFHMIIKNNELLNLFLDKIKLNQQYLKGLYKLDILFIYPVIVWINELDIDLLKQMCKFIDTNNLYHLISEQLHDYCKVVVNKNTDEFFIKFSGGDGKTKIKNGVKADYTFDKIFKLCNNNIPEDKFKNIDHCLIHYGETIVSKARSYYPNYDTNCRVFSEKLHIMYNFIVKQRINDTNKVNYASFDYLLKN